MADEEYMGRPKYTPIREGLPEDIVLDAGGRPATPEEQSPPTRKKKDEGPDAFGGRLGGSATLYFG